MKKIFLLQITFLAATLLLKSQPYTSYITGSANDVNTTTQSGTCLMGGATEDDNAMRWFLNLSGGGDIVVLRATGTNGYNNYLFSQLGVTVNSVETIVIPSVAAANDAYVRTQIRNAEAIFIAGGNQADYVNYWKNTAVDSALNYLINIKKVPIGGTSAGMAIMGQAYNSAVIGSITSAEAVANPFNSKITIGNNDFLHNPFLKRIITDTHFDNPDRRGRLVTFLARLIKDSSAPQLAIACDEYTAVCIDKNGLATVYGGYPTYDDNAYFVSVNCDVANNLPENCIAGSALNWVQSNAALKVYRIKGNTTGSNTFNTTNFKTGVGGSWQHWYVSNGILKVDSSVSVTMPICTPPLSINTNTSQTISPNKAIDIKFYPNPVKDLLNVTINKNVSRIRLLTSAGLEIYSCKNHFETKHIAIKLPKLKTTLLFICYDLTNGETKIEKVITVE